MSSNNFKISVEIENNVTNADEANQYIDTLEQMGVSIEHLKERSAQLVDAWDSLTPAKRAQRMRRLREAMIATADGTIDLKKETAELAKTNKKTSKTTRNLTKNTNLLDRAYKKLRNRVVAVGVAFASYFSIKKISGFFTSAVSGAANLEAQLDKVQAVSGATDEQMQAIAASAEKLGATTKYTATEAAQGFEILARAGLDTQQSLTAIPSVLDLAQAAGVGLADAAGYITKTVSGMNMAMSESGHVADVLAKAAASANTDVAGLGQALSYAAPTAKSLGVSLEDTVAIIGKFADAGIDASRAGTALNSVMAQFSNPASKFRQELSAIGINTNDFVEALRQLEASGQRGAKAINAVGLEAGPALKALLSQGLPSVDELSNKLKNANGAAAEMAKTMNDNLLGATKGLGSAWDTLKNTLGKPFLAPVTVRVRELTGIIKGLVDSKKIEALGKVFAENFDKMAGKALAFIEGFNLSKVSNEISDFTDGVSGKLEKLGALLSGIYNTFATFGNAMKTGTYAIGNAFSQVGADLAGLVPGLSGVQKELQEFANDTAEKVVESGEDLINSSTRLRADLKTLIATTKEATNVTKQQETATNKLTTAQEEQAKALQKEIEAFNKKGQRLQELKEIEKAYELQIIKNDKRSSQITAERIKLENELAKKIEGKVLSSTAEADATKKSADAEQAATEATNKHKAAIEQQIEKLEKVKNKTPEVTAEINKLKTELLSANPAFKELASNINNASSAEQLKQIGEAAFQAFQAGKISAEEYDQALTNIATKVKQLGDSHSNATQKIKENTAATKDNAQAVNESARFHQEAAKSTAEFRKEAAKSKPVQISLGKELANNANTWRIFNDTLKSTYTRGFASWMHAQNAAWAALRKLRDEIKSAGVANDILNEKIENGTVTMSDLGTVASAAANGIGRLDDAQLRQLNATLDKARDKIKALKDEAREAAESTRERLIDATGSEDEKINYRYNKEVEELRQKAAKNPTGQGDYQTAIANLEQLRKIELEKAKKQAAEQRQREQERQEQQQQSRRQPTPQPIPTEQLSSEFNQAFAQGVNQSDLSGFVQALGDSAGKQLIAKLTEEAKMRAH